MDFSKKSAISGYSKYNIDAQRRIKVNVLKDVYPELPNGKYDIIYADPPWDYGKCSMIHQVLNP